MPTPTYTPLANITLSSSASSVTFSSISQSYKDLVLVIDAGNAGNVYNGLRARFNGDSGSNYSWLYALGNGSTTVSGIENAVAQVNIGAAGASRSSTIVSIFGYSSANKHKSLLTRRAVNDASGYSVGLEAGRWASTSAINSIVIFDQSGYNLDAGSSFSLFGISG